MQVGLVRDQITETQEIASAFPRFESCELSSGGCTGSYIVQVLLTA
jgi:hypothetical protein